MIKKAFWITSIATLLTMAGVCLYFFFAESWYKKEIVRLQPIKKSPSIESQKRFGIQKDLYIIQNKERIHLCLQSEVSEIFLFQKKKKMELVEALQDIHGFIQDKIETDASNRVSQQLRYFKGTHGTYSFPSHSFQAEEISLGFFHLPGEEIPPTVNLQEAYLKGTAEKLSFFFSGKAPFLEAYHFKAEYKP